jgi:hypothetical protein
MIAIPILTLVLGSSVESGMLCLASRFPAVSLVDHSFPAAKPWLEAAFAGSGPVSAVLATAASQNGADHSPTPTCNAGLLVVGFGAADDWTLVVGLFVAVG